jgi:hypothetical protein
VHTTLDASRKRPRQSSTPGVEPPVSGAWQDAPRASTRAPTRPRTDYEPSCRHCTCGRKPSSFPNDRTDRTMTSAPKSRPPCSDIPLHKTAGERWLERSSRHRPTFLQLAMRQYPVAIGGPLGAAAAEPSAKASDAEAGTALTGPGARRARGRRSCSDRQARSARRVAEPHAQSVVGLRRSRVAWPWDGPRRAPRW